MPEAPQFPSLNVLAYSVTLTPGAARHVRIHTKETEPFEIVFPVKIARELADELGGKIISSGGEQRKPRYRTPHAEILAVYEPIEERIKQAGPGATAAAICREMGIRPRNFYVWRHHRKYNGAKA